MEVESGNRISLECRNSMRKGSTHNVIVGCDDMSHPSSHNMSESMTCPKMALTRCTNIVTLADTGLISSSTDVLHIITRRRKNRI